jgi:hypothetical protein
LNAIFKLLAIFFDISGLHREDASSTHGQHEEQQVGRRLARDFLPAAPGGSPTHPAAVSRFSKLDIPDRDRKML